MDDLSDVNTEPMVDSNFVKPFRMAYKQNGNRKIWDLVKVHNSVSIIIYNTTRNVLIFVKQFRPGVYYNSIPPSERSNPIDTKKYPARLGFTIELCAGIVDKDKSLEEIAAEEVFEECGYKIDHRSLEFVTQYRSSVGISGDVQTLFFIEVTDTMNVTSGGGNTEEGELIEVVEMTVDQVQEYMKLPSICSPSGLLFAVQWFLSNKIK